MKRIILSIFLFCTYLGYSQNKPEPLVILDSKNIGFMNQAQKILDPINPDDISTITVYKGETAKKYNSDSGVIIITTKKFILDTFYKNNIENSPLKKEIPDTAYLSKVFIIGSKAESKNLPYDELLKYIDTNNINDKVLKIKAINFIKPKDSQKMNPDWKFGALEIMSAKEE